MDVTLVTRIAGAAIAFLIAAIASPLALRLLRERIVDVPNARSSHTLPTPRGGGIVIVLGVSIGLLITDPLSHSTTVALATACALAVLGLIEDVRGLPIWVRFGSQLCIGIVGTTLILADATAIPLLAAVTLGSVWLVGYTNAFNFMDGINGISAAQLVIAGLVWIVVGEVETMRSLQSVGAVTIGAALGFLPWNFPRARYFMGDVGSYFSGSWIAMVVLAGIAMGASPVPLVASVAVYIADTSYTLLARIVRGEEWLQPHRSHVFQRLVAGGWSHPRTTFFYAVVSILVSACGLLWMSTSIWLKVLGLASGVTIIVVYLTSPDTFQNRTGIIGQR